MMPLPAMLGIILHLAGGPLAGAALFSWWLGLSEGPIFLGAGVGAALYAPVISRGKESKWSWFFAYFVFGLIFILVGLGSLGWMTLPRI